MKSERGKLIRLHPEARVEDLTDEGLVAACATGDRAARSLLFERYVDAVYRFVRRMRGSDPASVDDLVQLTFLGAYRAAEQFRGGNVRGWLYGIASNQVKLYARTEIRRKRALEAVAQLPPVTGTADPMLAAKLPDAIAALPHDLRAALVLIDLEGEKGIDAAAALGIPPGTLWRRVFEARQKLRAVIGGAS
ncbi:MAG: sigma-70 family RNA polymerase sigma factor [Deltaproteobacteria bacterium]|nr:sigma-70 family RNA polymerase sigma factor [Deltaproteobacteria bacterium]